MASFKILEAQVNAFVDGQLAYRDALILNQNNRKKARKMALKYCRIYANKNAKVNCLKGVKLVYKKRMSAKDISA